MSSQSNGNGSINGNNSASMSTTKGGSVASSMTSNTVMNESVEAMFNALKQKDNEEHLKKLKDRKHVQNDLIKLEKILFNTIKILQNAESNLLNGMEQCGQPFKDNIQKYVLHLKHLGDSTQNMNEFPVPIQLIEKIDYGINPDVVMQGYYSWTEQRNEHARGRIKDTYIYEQSLYYGVQLLDKLRDELNLNTHK